MNLRAIDWRFLLPDPAGHGRERLVLLGGTAAHAATIAAAGVARSVETGVGGAETADCVVVLRGAPLDPAAVAQALRPGGVAYIEVDRASGPYRRGPGSLHRLLRGAGLTIHATYGVLPDFDRTQIRFPLEHGGTLAWYLHTMFIADTPFRRVARPLLGALARSPRGARAALLPRYAVVAAKRPYAAPSVLGCDGLPGGLNDPRLRPLVLTRGDGDGSRAAFFPFAPGEREPRAVLKLSRLAERNEYTINEQRVLARLRADLPPDLAHAIPEPLGSIRWSGLAVGMERCVRGRVLTATSARGTGGSAVDDLRLAAAWLTRLHGEVQVGTVGPSLEGLERYAGTFGLTSAEERLFAAAKRRHAELHHVLLPRVWQHWGFGEWNIYRDGSTLAVIDWEGGELGLPLYDLLHLATTWYATASDRTVSVADATRDLFAERLARNRLVVAARDEIARYVHVLGIDPGYLPLLLTTYWVSRVLGHSRRGRRSENPHIAHVSALAGAVDALFA